jgi:methanogenic corrinoid protein MtbC1
MRVRAADWLRAHRDELAEQVTERHFQRHPELVERYGPQGRARCREDNGHHLDYLQQAVATGQQQLLDNYIVWARVLLQHLGIPSDDLRDNLGLLLEVVHESAPDELRTEVSTPLADVLGRFESLPSTVDTFIDPRRPHAGLARRYLDLLLAGQRRQAGQLVMQAADDGMALADIYVDVFQVVQYEVGRLWQLNEVSVAQEHYCTAATQLVMSQLYPRLFGAEPNGLVLVTACVSGDLHEMGARMLTDFFEMEGWDTYYLGANTPSRSLATLVRDNDADLVALSATMVAHVPRVADAIEAIRALSPGMPIMVGGYPFLQAPDLVGSVGADATAVDAREAVQTGLRLVRG